MTQPARQGFLRRFERDVDPGGELDPRERARRAERALRAHMLRLARASAVARAERTKRYAPTADPARRCRGPRLRLSTTAAARRHPAGSDERGR